MANQTSFSVLRAPLALLGVLATTFAGPWVAFPASHVLPSPVTTFIFVAPQIVFPYTTLVRYHETGNKAVFSESLALVLDILQWTLVMLAFVFFSRGVDRWPRLVGLSTIVVVGVTIMVCLIITALGLSFDVDAL